MCMMNRKRNEKLPYIFHFSPNGFFRCKKNSPTTKSKEKSQRKNREYTMFFSYAFSPLRYKFRIRGEETGIFFNCCNSFFSISRAWKRHKTIFFRFFLAVSVRENILLAVVCFYNFPAENRKVKTERRRRAQENKLKTHWQRKLLKK